MTRLVMTLLVRDEIDIVADNIDFHLAHGVDFVIATDNGSQDGTREVLAEYERSGRLALVDEPGRDYSQSEWVTRMAILARNRFGADWILNNDADEFWYPASGDLKTGLDVAETDMYLCPRKNMVFGAENAGITRWAELAHRVLAPIPVPQLDDPMRSPLPQPFFYLNLLPKSLCRARGLVSVRQGNHRADYDFDPVATTSDRIDVLHFPIRSHEQFFRKVSQGGAAYERNTKLHPSVGWHWRRWYRMLQDGQADQALSEALPSERRLERDLEDGVVVIDRRLHERMGGTDA